MADFYTQFAFEIDGLTDAEAEWARDMRDFLNDYDNRDDERFAPLFDDPEFARVELTVNDDGYDGSLFFEDDTGEGSVEDAAAIVREFLRLFRPDDIVAFAWANTCSKPRPNAFGGGAVVITATGEHWINTAQWSVNKVREIKEARS